MSEASERPETGPMEFEEDWTGVFVRGDQAFYYVAQISAVLELMGEQWGEGYAGLQAALEDLKATLASCNHAAQDPSKQLMKSWKECRR